MNIWIITRGADVIGFTQYKSNVDIILNQLRDEAAQFASDISAWLAANPEPEQIFFAHDNRTAIWDSWDLSYTTAIAQYRKNMSDRWPHRYNTRVPAYTASEIPNIHVDFIDG